MRKIQIAIGLSSDLFIRLTWNLKLTGSCGQQQRLRGWSRMVVKQFQDGGRPPFWKSDFQEILYIAADFELDERRDQRWNSCIGQTPSSTERILLLLLLLLLLGLKWRSMVLFTFNWYLSLMQFNVLCSLSRRQNDNGAASGVQYSCLK